MATGTVILIHDEFESSVKEQHREKLGLIECAQKVRALGLIVGNKDTALQPPYEVEHPFTFHLYSEKGPFFTGKASGETYNKLQYLVNRGWSLIDYDLVIMSGERKETEQLERIRATKHLYNSVRMIECQPTYG